MILHGHTPQLLGMTIMRRAPETVQAYVAFRGNPELAWRLVPAICVTNDHLCHARLELCSASCPGL